jgi:hypothetical protein
MPKTFVSPAGASASPRSKWPHGSASVDDLPLVAEPAGASISSWTVLRVHERDLDPVHVDGAALVRVVGTVGLGNANHREVVAKLDRRDDGALELLRQLERVADVVVVPVGDEDRVDALRLLLVLRALRVAVEERIDVDALAARVYGRPVPRG